MLFQKWRYGFEILVQMPGYSVLAFEKNCNTCSISSGDVTKVSGLSGISIAPSAFKRSRGIWTRIYAMHKLLQSKNKH